MPRGETAGQNLGHLKKGYSAFSFMETPSKNIRSNISVPQHVDFWVMRGRSG